MALLNGGTIPGEEDKGIFTFTPVLIRRARIVGAEGSPAFIRLTAFARIEAEFDERAHQVVRCVAAMVDARPLGDPPAPPAVGGADRVAHPVPSYPEAARFARSLCLSLDYVTDVWHPVYAE